MEGENSEGPRVVDVNTEGGSRTAEQIKQDGGGSWVNVDTFKESLPAQRVREERERKEQKDKEFWGGLSAKKRI